jgi:acetyl-CoA carboxylase carboxyl transferase subunit alpha
MKAKPHHSVNKNTVKVHKGLSAWERVQLARNPQRPYVTDYMPLVFGEFLEIHGDRTFSDDPATIAGFTTLDDQPVMVFGQRRGHDTKENIQRNFGMSHPEGYRKALRLFKMAEKFKKPIITFVDTSGAYPGLGAEERGQAEAIARNLLEMAKLCVPVITVILGEGGSGGAIGIAVSNKVLMLENAVYSVISPEGCAAILWNDREKIQQAAEVLKLTAVDLLRLKIIDEIIPEPVGGAHTDYEATAKELKKCLVKVLKPLLKLSPSALKDQRYGKFRAMGVFKD